MGQFVDEIITLIALGDSRHPEDYGPIDSEAGGENADPADSAAGRKSSWRASSPDAGVAAR
jgi:hypothetical protein